MADRPNIFAYATSELSQDAFLCWLLDWADPTREALDRDLHRVGRVFLDALFVAAGVEAPAASSAVRVGRQVKAADIVAEIGRHHLLVIEDKTATENHSQQLDRYRARLGKAYEDRELVCVYLKTGDQSSYANVRAKGWAAFRRLDLLQVLRQGSAIEHDVFRDFVEHLEGIERDVARYRTAPPADWGTKRSAGRDPAYRGLFLALQAAGIDGDWKYVPNKAGGFLGFWERAKRSVEGGLLYLQLEEDELVVKVEAFERKQRKNLRDRWHQRAVQHLDGFARPARFGHGRWMTVAKFAGDYRATTPEGLLDLSATVAHLRSVISGLAEMSAAEESARLEGEYEEPPP